ncbi:hypothetical protein GOP47_0009611 [Adiantum capillus-veneris]|uniref:Protein RER1 n=1 Tax=Adiantum capillus-veneris TaxID=13818 RepID=A0A9D4ZJU0_ADICA|nr:hypothetical protein GOP47_0009611 [Adiantum capillus-veneris]
MDSAFTDDAGGAAGGASSPFVQWRSEFSRKFQHYLDKSTPHASWRWLVDPESEGPTLPSKGSDEFKPFIRRLPEFKFWYAFTKAFCVAFLMTFFSIFDVPVFWPILLLYWIVLFVLTMKRQIRHMIKFRYVPFNMGKQKYTGKKPASDRASSSRH